MILRPDKNFKPCASDVDDELFPNGIFVFNITKMLDYIGTHPEDFPIEEVPVASLGFTSQRLDEATVSKADLTKPLLLAEIAPGQFNVIDGNHRLEKARREGATLLPVWRVGPRVHTRFLISSESYREYVSYWNSKVRGH
ncbi:MAG: hypothetical protein FJ146_17055 [Deltaproteobacteria bacterium]|nr:hypothetical protein [Deltaproteobacteria bacterium]